MSRRARGRILYDGCYAHVYSRALEKRFIFRDEADFVEFKQRLMKVKEAKKFKIHHYCLMNTHFHMVVSIAKLEEFSAGLRELKQEYVKWYHTKYKKRGPVWWGRFGSQLIESEKYMYACGLYVEMNPVKAEMVNRAEDWPHSSSQYYLLGQEDELVNNYQKPSYEIAQQLTEGLNVGRGSYIGTPLFLLNNGMK